MTETMSEWVTQASGIGAWFEWWDWSFDMTGSSSTPQWQDLDSLPARRWSILSTFAFKWEQGSFCVCMLLANERWRYNVMSSLIGWAHAQIDSCESAVQSYYSHNRHHASSPLRVGWVGLWGFLWWAPSAKRKDHHGVSSGWSSVWHSSNTGLSSTQYEQIPIILGVWPFWLTPFVFRSITFWRAYG